jgi:hypothetical protein
MEPTQLDTHHKAVQINMDKAKYGTFAEIGAGQEVARWFLRVDAVSGTGRRRSRPMTSKSATIFTEPGPATSTNRASKLAE